MECGLSLIRAPAIQVSLLWNGAFHVCYKLAPFVLTLFSFVIVLLYTSPWFQKKKRVRLPSNLVTNGCSYF